LYGGIVCGGKEGVKNQIMELKEKGSYG